MSIVIEETKHKIMDHTRQHLLQFLFFYDEITFEQKREDPNDPKLINMLPQIVKLAEGLL